jgi:hypothetical protein
MNRKCSNVITNRLNKTFCTTLISSQSTTKRAIFPSQLPPDEYLTARWKMLHVPSRSKPRQIGFAVTDRDLPSYRRRHWIRLTELQLVRLIMS